MLGDVLRKIGVARFTRTLATLLSSGVPILEGLDITARTSGNAILEDVVRQLRRSIEEGKTIADPMRESKFFPAMVTQMVSVGESTGELDTMLVKVADYYEEEVDVVVANLLTILEPVMMVVLGVIVGGIVIAMYMPLFKLIQFCPEAKTIPTIQALPCASRSRGRHQSSRVSRHMAELSRHLLWLIALRALILFLIVNLAEPLDLLPARFGPYSFLPFFNIVTVTLTFLCLALWWNDKAPGWQLYFQAGADLILATVLVAVSGGINSVFVSIYLLIIIYCSLLLGQQGGMVGAAVSAILFSGIAAADKLGILTPGSAPLGVQVSDLPDCTQCGRLFRHCVPRNVPPPPLAHRSGTVAGKNHFARASAGPPRTHREQHPERTDHN